MGPAPDFVRGDVLLVEEIARKSGPVHGRIRIRPIGSAPAISLMPVALTVKYSQAIPVTPASAARIAARSRRGSGRAAPTL